MAKCTSLYFGQLTTWGTNGQPYPHRLLYGSTYSFLCGLNKTDVMVDVNISPNPNTFNFWTAECEYIKKKLEYEYIFFPKLKESVILSESI